MFKFMSRTIWSASLFVLMSTSMAVAQDSATGSASPEGVPPEIAAMLGEGVAEGADTSIAAPESPAEDVGVSTDATVAGSNYLYTSLRVINNGASRGCASGNWACMSNLCKADLGPTAWRGWAGCWKEGSNFICYFECGRSLSAF